MKILKNYAPHLYSTFVDLNQQEYANMSNTNKFKYKMILYGMTELFAYDPSLIRTMRIVKQFDFTDDIGKKSIIIIKSMIEAIKPYITKKSLYGPVITILINLLFVDNPTEIYNVICNVMESDMFHSIQLQTILVPIIEHSRFLIQSEIELIKEIE